MTWRGGLLLKSAGGKRLAIRVYMAQGPPGHLPPSSPSRAPSSLLTHVLVVCCELPLVWCLLGPAVDVATGT